jgi:hypothetical protein
LPPATIFTHDDCGETFSNRHKIAAFPTSLRSHNRERKLK